MTAFDANVNQHAVNTSPRNLAVQFCMQKKRRISQLLICGAHLPSIKQASLSAMPWPLRIPGHATANSIRFITWQNLVFRWFADLPSVYVLFIPIYAQHWCFCLRRLASLVLLPATHTLSSDHLMTLLNTCWTKQEFLTCWRFITQHIDALCQPHQTVISSSITSRQSCLSWIYS